MSETKTWLEMVKELSQDRRTTRWYEYDKLHQLDLREQSLELQAKLSGFELTLLWNYDTRMYHIEGEI